MFRRLRDVVNTYEIVFTVLCLGIACLYNSNQPLSVPLPFKSHLADCSFISIKNLSFENNHFEFIIRAGEFIEHPIEVAPHLIWTWIDTPYITSITNSSRYNITRLSEHEFSIKFQPKHSGDIVIKLSCHEQIIGQGNISIPLTLPDSNESRMVGPTRYTNITIDDNIFLFSSSEMAITRPITLHNGKTLMPVVVGAHNCSNSIKGHAKYIPSLPLDFSDFLTDFVFPFMGHTNVYAHSSVVKRFDALVDVTPVSSPTCFEDVEIDFGHHLPIKGVSFPEPETGMRNYYLSCTSREIPGYQTKIVGAHLPLSQLLSSVQEARVLELCPEMKYLLMFAHDSAYVLLDGRNMTGKEAKTYLKNTFV